MVTKANQLDKRKLGFFIIENDIFDSGVAARIGTGAFSVYSYLIRRAGNDLDCYPSIETICKDTGISKPTAIKSINRLIKEGLIERDHSQTVNHYIISDHLQSKRALLSKPAQSKESLLVENGQSKKSLPPELNNLTPPLTRRRLKEEDKGKPSTKRPRGIDLSCLPSGITEQRALDFIEHRFTMKKPLSQRAFDLSMKQAVKAKDHGLTPDQVIDIAIEAGWRGINAEWASNRLEGRRPGDENEVKRPHRPLS